MEEQDDTVVWICHAMKGAGADLDVLLRGNAVNYAVTAQDASGLQFGSEPQTQPPKLAEDLNKPVGKGVKVFISEEDLNARGIGMDQLIPGLEPITRNSFATLFEHYGQVWHW